MPLPLLAHDDHVIIWTNQSPADVLRLSPCVTVLLIFADPSDGKTLMPPDLNRRVHDTKSSKTEPSQHGWRSFPLHTYA